MTLRAESRIYQAIYIPHVKDDAGKQGIYEITHNVRHAPWVPHASSRLTAPKHVKQMHDWHLARHEDHVVSDGTTTHTLTAKVTAIVIEPTATGHRASVNVGWFWDDGTPSHGIHYTVPLSDDHAKAHRTHLAKVAATIPVDIRRSV